MYLLSHLHASLDFTNGNCIINKYENNNKTNTKYIIVTV